MSTRSLPLRAWPALVGAEARMVVRDTGGLIVPFGLPVLILVMVGITVTELPLSSLGGRLPVEIAGIPVATATVLGVVGAVNLPSFLALYRRSGVLRRLEVTPAGATPVLVAQVVVGVVQALLGVALAVTVAVLGFGAGLPAAPVTALGVVALAVVAFFALGMLIAALAPTANSAVAAGLVVFLGTGALGGMFGPPDALPGPLATIGEVLPFGAVVQSLGAAWRGELPDAGPVIGMVGTAVVAAAVAVAVLRRG